MIYTAFEALILALFANAAAAAPAFRVVYNTGAPPYGLNEVSPQRFFSAEEQTLFTITSRGLSTVLATAPNGSQFGQAPLPAANARGYTGTGTNGQPPYVISVTPKPGSLRSYPAPSLLPGFNQALPDGTLLGRGETSNTGIYYLAYTNLDGGVTAFYQFPSGEEIVSIPFLASDGNYYGVSWASSGPQLGASYVFRVTPSGTLTKLVNLPNGSGYPDSMLQATDGKVFTLTTMHLLIDQTRIREYRSR